MTGKLIVIDGLDGSGKQTQTQLLYDRLTSQGTPVRSVSFPDYKEPSSALVKMYLAGELGQAEEVSAYAASSFYAVDRYASYNKFWKNDYLSGYTLIADRYATSNIIHQMSKLPKEQWKDFLCWMEDFEYSKLALPRPDRVIYLDMNPEVSRELLSRRYHGDEKKKDIHEANFNYLLKCRDCALYAAQHLLWKVVRCSDEKAPYPVRQIAQMVYEAAKLD